MTFQAVRARCAGVGGVLSEETASAQAPEQEAGCGFGRGQGGQ